MAPRTRSAGRLTKGRPATPQHSLGTQVIHVSDANTRGFPALADELYLEIMSHIPSVPIPTPINLPSYPEIRRSRHETLLSLSQTCRSLRKNFGRYLWQRIEVREGMKAGAENDTLKEPILSCTDAGKKSGRMYAVELVRQLEIVTVRNPQLAQHVNYLDILIGDYSFNRVLAELARCLSLFSNLHTIQIDAWGSMSVRRSLEVVERTFKKYSYPQIHNVFVSYLSRPFLVSCPEARRIGFTQQWSRSSLLHTIIDNCPCLEALDDFDNLITESHNTCKFVIDSFPNLHHITISPSLPYNNLSERIDAFAKLDQLQSITLFLELARARRRQRGHLVTEFKKIWLDKAKEVLIAIQRRDKLEKLLTIVTIDSEVDSKVTQTIVLKPPFGDSMEIINL